MSTDEFLCMVCFHVPDVHARTGPRCEPCHCCESTFALAVQDDLFGAADADSTTGDRA